MIEDTPLTKTIRGNPDPENGAENADINYDKAAKIVLSDRRVIAWLLRKFVVPYKDLSIEQIVDLILDVSTSSKNTVSPEVESPDERHANSDEYYRLDVVVTATIPGETKAQFYINIEHQRDPYPGYLIVVRSVTYAGAMLASEPLADFPVKNTRA